MKKERLVEAVNAVTHEYPITASRLLKAGQDARSHWLNASYGAREAACEVAIEVQLITELHAIAWRKSHL